MELLYLTQLVNDCVTHFDIRGSADIFCVSRVGKIASYAADLSSLCPVLCGFAASEPITWLFSLPPELPPLLVTRALRRVPLSHQEVDRSMTDNDSGSHFSDCSPAEGQHWSLLAFASSLWQPQESSRGTGKGKGLSK